MKKVLSFFLIAMLAMPVWANTTAAKDAETTSEITFDAKVDKGDGEVTVRHHFTVVKNPVTMYVGDGQLNTTGHYRIYGPNDSSALNFTSTGAPIIKIEFFGLFGYQAYHMSLAEGTGGTWTTNENDGVWEGNAQFVNFDINLQARFTKIIVTIAGPLEPEFLLGDVNLDGSVTIADVSALIDYLLTDASLAPIEADTTLDGETTINDLTTLIDYLLVGEW